MTIKSFVQPHAARHVNPTLKQGEVYRIISVGDPSFENLVGRYFSITSIAGDVYVTFLAESGHAGDWVFGHVLVRSGVDYKRVLLTEIEQA